MVMTLEERKASRKITLKKYRSSRKNYENQLRYRKKNMEKFRKLSKDWYWKHPEHSRQLQRDKYATPEGKAIRDAIEKRYNKKNRIKKLAKDSVHNAIVSGRMKRLPCSICGNEKSEGHHPNYTKPLDVIWLCHKHHKEQHGRGK